MEQSQNHLSGPLSVDTALARLGARLKFLRKARGITAEQMAAKLLISRTTLRGLESGAAGVGIGTLAGVLQVLNELDSLAAVAPVDDVLLSKARKQSTEKPVISDSDLDF